MTFGNVNGEGLLIRSTEYGIDSVCLDSKNVFILPKEEVTGQR